MSNSGHKFQLIMWMVLVILKIEIKQNQNQNQITWSNTTLYLPSPQPPEPKPQAHFPFDIKPGHLTRSNGQHPVTLFPTWNPAKPLLYSTPSSTSDHSHTLSP